MIEVRTGSLAEADAEAVLRPVASDLSAVTPAMRRFEELAGPEAAEQWRRSGELPVGSAVITPAGELTARFVVHVAVRAPDENPTAGAIRRGLLNGLRRLEEWQIDSVAMAPLGTGAGNLDAEEAAGAMLPVLVEHLRTADHPSRVVIVVEDPYQETAFAAAVARHAGERAGAGS